jgi:hypothetical protein
LQLHRFPRLAGQLPECRFLITAIAIYLLSLISVAGWSSADLLDHRRVGVFSHPPFKLAHRN